MTCQHCLGILSLATMIDVKFMDKLSRALWLVDKIFSFYNQWTIINIFVNRLLEIVNDSQIFLL